MTHLTSADRAVSFVLVPGAWLGAWAWDDVAEGLRARGHEVHAVSLTGMAERAGEATPDTGLGTHVDDVLAALDGLGDAVLVGHSYAAAVVTVVADRVPDRLAGVVYVDAAPLPDGMSLLDLSSPEEVEAHRATLAAGDDWRLPFPGWEAFGPSAADVSAEARERALAALSPQPFATFAQPVRATGAGDAVPRGVIVCDTMRPLIAGGPLSFLAEPPWVYRELDSGHWPMLSVPDALADVLADVAVALDALDVSAVIPSTPATG